MKVKTAGVGPVIRTAGMLDELPGPLEVSGVAAGPSTSF